MAGELDDSWERVVTYRASLDGLELLEVWLSSVTWVEENGWEITDRRYGEYIRFNHVRMTRKSSIVRKAEIRLADSGDGVSLEFRVERRTIFSHETYKKALDSYLKHLGVNLSEYELSKLQYKGYLIDYTVTLRDVNAAELWSSTVEWVERKKWKIHEVRDNEYIRFNHVSGMGSGTTSKEAELCFTDKHGILTVEFKLKRWSIIENKLWYQQEVEKFFNRIGVNLEKDDYSRLYSEKDLNLLIRNDVLYIIFFNLFPLYFVCRGIYHWTIFALVLVWTSMSIPSILNVIHYKKLRNLLYRD